MADIGRKLAVNQVSRKIIRPGDIVTVMLPGNLPHIMLVSDKKDFTSTRTPLVIHNIGRGTQEEYGLFAYPITGHFRLPKSTLKPLNFQE